MTLGGLFLEGGAWPFLLLAPLVWLALWATERVRARRLDRALGGRVPELVVGVRRRMRPVRRAVFTLALLFSILAALGPAVGRAAGEMQWRGVDIVVCLDVSRSMLARDEDPDRLSRAQREIRALAERAQGDRLGLVVFAGAARLVSPLTSDGESLVGLTDLAHPTDIARGGTDLGAALDVALAALAGREGEHGAVLLLTDGEDLAATGLRAAQRCRAAGVVVHAVGFGSVRGSKITVPGARGPTFLRDRAGADVISALDARSLRAIADASEGRYVEAAANEAPLVDLYEERVLPMARAAYSSKDDGRRENRYQWPLGVALLLWLLHLGLAPRRRA